MKTIRSDINCRGLRRTAVILTSTAVLAAVAASPATGHESGSAAPALRVVATTHSTRPHTWSYTWPIKPFDRQHPVRAFLNDPRIGDKGGKAFHFGIDISAPDGTPVYAVEAGTVYLDSPVAIAVVARDRSHSFGYWHIVPAVKSHQYVARHQLLGHVGTGWEHVHFAERRGGEYVNPLRDGGLGPYADRTAPTVDSIAILGSSLVAVAHDTPDPRVPGSWADEPVTPGQLRVRIDNGSWKTAVDFRETMLSQSRFSQIYTPATRQNHKGEPGCFSFYLARGWDSTKAHRVEVEASDTAGNSTVVAMLVGIAL